MIYAKAIQQIDWLIHLLKDFYTTQLLFIIVFCSNQAIIQLFQNPNYLNQTKHQDLKYFYIKDALNATSIVFQDIYIITQLVDTFTKPLPCNQHIKLCLSIDLYNFSNNKWERQVVSFFVEYVE